MSEMPCVLSLLSLACLWLCCGHFAIEPNRCSIRLLPEHASAQNRSTGAGHIQAFMIRSCRIQMLWPAATEARCQHPEPPQMTEQHAGVAGVAGVSRSQSDSVLFSNGFFSLVLSANSLNIFEQRGVLDLARISLSPCGDEEHM